MKRVWIRTLYKFLGNFESIGCNNIIVPEVDSISTRLDSTWTKSIQTISTSLHQVDLMMLWHETMGHINGEKKLRAM